MIPSMTTPIYVHADKHKPPSKQADRGLESTANSQINTETERKEKGEHGAEPDAST